MATLGLTLDRVSGGDGDAGEVVSVVRIPLV